MCQINQLSYVVNWTESAVSVSPTPTNAKTKMHKVLRKLIAKWKMQNQWTKSAI